MKRRQALLVVALLVVSSAAASGQALSTLRITVTLTDATGTPAPLARHALLISEEPPSTAPRRIRTTLAGTADISLPPGRYAIESDQPVAFEGKTYEWSQRIDIVAGRDTTLALTAANASIDTAAPAASPARSSTDPSLLAAQWQDSVVGLWTPTEHASGFLVDARGLIVTNQRVVGTATSVEAQLTRDIKVTAAVLASDPARDVAILWVNPQAVASVRHLPLACGQAEPPVTVGEDLYNIGAEMTGEKRLTLGGITGVGPRLLLSDMRLVRAGVGGPMFTAAGLVGFTTIDVQDPDDRSNARVVRIGQACEVLAAAEKRMAEMTPPDATNLPLDTQRRLAPSALEAAIKGRAGNLSPYSMSAADFDIAFITPVHLYGTRDQVRRPVMEFGRWSEYMADYPRVLLVRVTPKVVEGLWAKIARGAAMTQGVELPPMKRAKSGLSRLRAFCGETEVTPIHPFMVEQRVSATEAVYEGLYVFDPASFGPQCGRVTLTVYPEKEPGKGDTRVVDPKVLEQITRDFASL